MQINCLKISVRYRSKHSWFTLADLVAGDVIAKRIDC